MRCSPQPQPLATAPQPPDCGPDPTARTWATVSGSALRANCALLHRMVYEKAGQSANVMAVVKADAYGHGAAWVARQAQSAGVRHFGIASVAEAGCLRRAGIHGDIYLLGNFLPHEAEVIVRLDVVPMLSSGEQWRWLQDAARTAPLPARAFLMVDTGMGREGLLPGDARDLWREATSKVGPVCLTGIATHFSSADETDGEAWNQQQTQVYRDFVLSLPPGTLTGVDDGRGERSVWLSLCNSPATLGEAGSADLSNLPLGSVRGTLFRAGLLLYGVEPYRGAFADAPGLHPILSWLARVTLVRDLPRGATVGYGRTALLARPSRIATVAAGYADGVPRRLGNRGHVLWHGQALPLVGRVSMDQCQIDVTDAQTPVQVGNTVTFIGSDGEQTQTVLDLAETIDTTPHEPTCLLTRRVPRVYSL